MPDGLRRPAAPRARAASRSPFRVCVAGRDGGVLLGLDHEPALVAGIPERAQHRLEVERAVARHREDAVDHALQKAPVALACLGNHLGTHILAMHMRHARHMFFQQRRRIGRAAVVGMAGIEQQKDLARIGQRHQAVHILRGFHLGAHVVVIGQPDAVTLQQVRAKGIQPPRIALPGRIVGKARAPGHRRAHLPLDRARAFAIDHHVDAVVAQPVHVGLAALGLGGKGLVVAARIGLRQKARVPAGDAGQPVRVEPGLERGAGFRKLVAQLETRVADLGALLQCRVQRRIAPQRREVVVHPGQGIDTDANLPVHASPPWGR